MRIEDITNFMQVSENIASSGQPVETQFGSIAAADYRLVVNLAMPNSDSAIPEEGNIVTALKMTYVHIPVPFESPTVKHLQAFMKIMSSFANDKIWVHCVVNY
ncbi:MAG: protein tyrosine phosphatase family protein, partial [Gammaproteobacteria bacterium]